MFSSSVFVAAVVLSLLLYAKEVVVTDVVVVQIHDIVQYRGGGIDLHDGCVGYAGGLSTSAVAVG